MPLDDDEFRDEVLEIKDRIVEEHHRGGHVIGPVAGCTICAQQQSETSAAGMGRVAAMTSGSALEDLARLRLTSAPPAASGEEPEYRINADDDVPQIELALADGENALADASNGRTSIANVRATVGVIRAVAAIDETLRTILAAIVNQQLEGDESEISPEAAALAALALARHEPDEPAVEKPQDSGTDDHGNDVVYGADEPPPAA